MLGMFWSEAAQILFSADHEGSRIAWDLERIRTGAPEGMKTDGEGTHREVFFPAP